MIALLDPILQDDSSVRGLIGLADRWLHLIAGVVWIGILYFFNWVNTAFVPTMDAETKKKVVPELMPRALWWFRWGAAFTWLTGVVLLMFFYYTSEPLDGPVLFDNNSEFVGETPSSFMHWTPFLGIFVGFVLYDQLFKMLAKQHSLAVLIWGLLAIGFGFFCFEGVEYSRRATYIHVAALFGTAMAANVWMRIWPAQKRIIRAIKEGQAPDPKDAGLAGLRSKHNTYMSVPLLLFMVSVNQPVMLSIEQYYVVLPTVLIIGFVFTYAMYGISKRVSGF